MTTRNEIEPLMTVKEVAERLAIAEKTVRNKVSAGLIPHVKIGGSLRFRPSEIAAWVDSQAVPAEIVA